LERLHAGQGRAVGGGGAHRDEVLAKLRRDTAGKLPQRVLDALSIEQIIYPENIKVAIKLKTFHVQSKLFTVWDGHTVNFKL